MLIIDITAGLVIAVAIAWGMRRGVQATLVVAGFAVGAVLGTRAPLLLGGDMDSSFSLVIALPAALVVGALVAAAVERRTSRPRRRRRHSPARRRLSAVGGALPAGRRPGGIGAALLASPRANTAGGAVLAGIVGVVGVWLVAPLVAQVSPLRDPLDRSVILTGLNSVLTPAGPPYVDPEAQPIDNFPTIAGPPPDVPAADPSVEKDPEVLAAQRSVVKIGVLSCGRGGQGSGWVAADRIVVTNAHVVAAADAITVRSRGTGPARVGTVIWFDRINDFALLRVPELKGVPALPMVRRPASGASGAALGFPAGVKAVWRARLGPTTRTRRGRIGGRLPPAFRRELTGRLVTTFKGRAQPGISGGPVVDTRGRVLTTVFGGLAATASGVGVPNRFVRRAIGKAGPTVGTGRCLNDADIERERER